MRSADGSPARARAIVDANIRLAEEARHARDRPRRGGASAMLRQLEGSRAVAETVARCRPHVVAAYPISPQTHIVEALSDLVASGELAPCEYLMVESEFGALSACIGASAAGARAYTATASQGLLFMAEALPNASGLGLPIVMTVANRALGAPDQHLERPLRRALPARRRLAAAVRVVQPGGRRPARAGLRPGRAAVPAGDGLHGRLRADPRHGGDRRTRTGPGRRASSRRSPRGSGSTPTTRSRSGRWSGRRPSPR